MKNIYFNKGSALLIALMIMSSLGVASLSAAKLFLSESKTSTNISQTASAYYAAESALEKALLAYRQDPSIQLSGSCDSRTSTNSCVAKASDQWFDSGGLNNTAKTYTKIYSASAISITNNEGIAQDQSKEFTIYSGVSATFDWEWENSPQTNQQGLRIIYINAETLTVDESRTPIFVDATSQSSVTLSTSISKTVIRVRPMGNSISSYTLTPSSGSIDSGITTIDVKSEYLDVSRQLQVKINRNKDQGNTLNSLFDYTLLSDCSLDQNVGC